ncbi:hypothetical protein [Mesorhizobium sp. M00.F.Ca.ET.216.01.1.1]|uniref:hypothetical protein n=1 Tax=Mesorhizobium sp. M00.F.Ca.ET.216.01.1.1 TaxID=2500528 RepID=UPI00167B4A4E|nr:hypothetical protein [Mesorhizobium sp. M00.F.Ca.ET.216.01.1.1]
MVAAAAHFVDGPNAAYAALCALISARSSLDGSRSRRGGSVAKAVAATVEAMKALPEWKSKVRRLILDVVNSPLHFMAG